MIPNVLSAAISHGCTMLHPGYGFLAENATFVEMCREHGINFIGPNVSNSIQKIIKKSICFDPCSMILFPNFINWSIY